MEAASPAEVEVTGDLNFTCEAFVFFLDCHGVIMGIMGMEVIGGW